MKAKNIKKLIVFSILIISGFLTNGQTINSEYLDYQKYWYYRNRLDYFIVPGADEGESMVAGIRNRLEDGNIRSLSFGQHGVYYGYYLGVLATEYYILSNTGQDASQTVQELNFALNAYVEQMDKCEEKFFNSTDNYDGFFIRDNITCDMNFVQSHSTELNKNLSESDTWDKFMDGRPGYIDAVQGCRENTPPPGRRADPMSQDEAIGLLKGLSLVYRCLPDNSTQKELSKEIALKIITKMWCMGAWLIKDTEGKTVDLGGIITTYAFSLSKVAEYFGQNHLCYWSTTDLSTYQTRRLSWQAMQYFGVGAMNNSMTTTLAAICDCWTPEATNPITGPLMNTTDEGLNFIGGFDDWDAFYIMQWEFLQNKRSPYLDKDDAKVMLAMAPCEGPYCWSVGGNRAFGGWASTYRFERSFESQINGEGLGFEGVYNGLDYMLLYNLYYITELRDWTDGVRNGKLLPPYINIKNWSSSNIAYPYQNFCNPANPSFIVGNDNMPFNGYGYNSITSSAIIDNVCNEIFQTNGQTYIGTHPGSNCFGNVTYRSGETITLKPGFAVRQGAYFHGYIKPFHCECVEYTSSGNNYNYGLEGDYDTSVSRYYYLKYHDDFKPNRAGEIIVSDTNNTAGQDICKVFPNPFAEKFNVEYSLSGASEVVITVINEKGSVLKSIDRVQGVSGCFVEVIDCNDIGQGIYNCVIKTNEYIKAIKIIKTR